MPGIFYPAGLVYPNSYDLTDFDNTTSLSGIPDSTAAVQAALDDAAVGGNGGIVVLPSGIIRLNGNTINGGGITVRGSGWEEYPGVAGLNSPAKRGKRGTYVLTDSTAFSTFTQAPEANNCQIKDVAFIQTHAPEGGGWTPTVFKPTIQVSGTASGGLTCERLLFWGCYQGIKLGAAGSPAGRITLRDITAACYKNGIIAQYVSDFLTIDNYNVVPQLLAGSPNMLAYILANLAGLDLYAVAKASILNVTAKTCKNGIRFLRSSDGFPQRVKVSSLDADGVLVGIGVDNTNGVGNANSVIRIDGYTFKGAALGASNLSLAIDANLKGGYLNFDNLQLSGFEASAIKIAGTGGDVRFGDNVWIDDWNKNPPVTGFANPASAIYSTASATNIYVSGINRYTNANGGLQTSGNTFLFSQLDNDAWTYYIPTVTAQSGAYISVSASFYYRQIAKKVYLVHGNVNIPWKGTAAGYIIVSMPFTMASSSWAGSGVTNGGTALAVQFSAANMLIFKYDNTTIITDGAFCNFTGVIEIV